MTNQKYVEKYYPAIILHFINVISRFDNSEEDLKFAIFNVGANNLVKTGIKVCRLQILASRIKQLICHLHQVCTSVWGGRGQLSHKKQYSLNKLEAARTNHVGVTDLKIILSDTKYILACSLAYLFAS